MMDISGITIGLLSPISTLKIEEIDGHETAKKTFSIQ